MNDRRYYGFAFLAGELLEEVADFLKHCHTYLTLVFTVEPYFTLFFPVFQVSILDPAGTSLILRIQYTMSGSSKGV